MNKTKGFLLTATFVAFLSTAVFAQGLLPVGHYVIIKDLPSVGVEPTFTATRYGHPTPIATNESIQAVIDAIRANAVYNYPGGTTVPIPANIQFGDGDTLDIGGDSVQFTGVWERITLYGKIISKSSSPTIKIGQNVTIFSEANIVNVGGGYAIHNSGELSITGGTVNAVACVGHCIPEDYSIPVYHNSYFPLILDGSPSIPSHMAGSIYIASGALRVAPNFDPGTNSYRIILSDEEVSAGRVVVVNGKAYADNFKGTPTLFVTKLKWSLAVSGNDLVIGEVEDITPIIKSKVSSGFGIVLNGNSLQVVGISQATPVQVYDLRGNVVMSRTALPNESVSVSHLPKGVYVAKVGGIVVKVVR
jgi:hypothetical protein